MDGRTAILRWVRPGTSFFPIEYSLFEPVASRVQKRVAQRFENDLFERRSQLCKATSCPLLAGISGRGLVVLKRILLSYYGLERPLSNSYIRRETYLREGKRRMG